MRNQHDNKYIIKSRLRIEGKKVNQNATTCNKNEIKQERRQEDKTKKREGGRFNGSTLGHVTDHCQGTCDVWDRSTYRFVFNLCECTHLKFACGCISTTQTHLLFAAIQKLNASEG